jgi:CheY-like chemotaxis protein
VNDSHETLTGTETVLLVENEPALKTLLQKHLTSLGYSLITAEDGLEAIEIFERDPAKIDAVVMDVNMPRMKGDDALRRMRELKPSIKAILTSAFPDSRNRATELKVSFVSKPFSLTTLAQGIRAVLDGRQI